MLDIWLWYQICDIHIWLFTYYYKFYEVQSASMLYIISTDSLSSVKVNMYLARPWYIDK